MAVKRKKSKHRCEICNKILMQELGEDGKYKTRSIKSEHTGNRYCWPGEGCFK